MSRFVSQADVDKRAEERAKEWADMHERLGQVCRCLHACEKPESIVRSRSPLHLYRKTLNLTTRVRSMNSYNRKRRRKRKSFRARLA